MANIEVELPVGSIVEFNPSLGFNDSSLFIVTIIQVTEQGNWYTLQDTTNCAKILSGISETVLKLVS